MFEVLEPHCEPVRSTKYSAYVDLFAREDCIIRAGETKIIKLGVKIDLEHLHKNCDMWCGHSYDLRLCSLPASKDIHDTNFNWYMLHHYLEVALRSSLAVKGLIIANGIGIIDLDYPDEIGLIVHNPTKVKYVQVYADYAGEPKIDVSDSFVINKGDKVAQCTLKEHKGYLMGYESDVVRTGGFGSTGQ